MEPIRIKFATNDGMEIVGHYCAQFDRKKEDKKDIPSVLFLHMMPATKESWKDFAKKLHHAGFETLAIDMRGHGESGGGPDGYKTFSDEQHQASVYDIGGAMQFLEDRGVSLSNIILVGASIGANLALQFIAEYPEIKTAILLSPGLNYRGVETEKYAKLIKPDQNIFLVAGGANDGYSTETTFKLHKIIKTKNKEIKTFQNAGHGTTIFSEEPSFMDDLALWLAKLFPVKNR
ncbi:TPA: hypothetical protein DEW47_02670 [Patescibacteria group bacterium]|nr:MAG: hypothetical protein UT71_C0004G0045 [Parcubacteria group bacterium GW2011_GWF2_40_10]KKR47227.1 MAG: hypothetical protein UT83_C0012G0028 [Parcubacteria group bacterium GW2011_GWA2_40_143]KKR60191.1 MAG: hypothetical protein UT97_C0004G0060 [Parcubacteria group bacterium GW2011_GWC2_40_31]KKR75060.1 MAG: hypothetical protein UU18_C0014G0005 [Parcubacteria group bacterium GW2011_GWB2_40_8]KKR77271.1 MAG: hypothetical protein UU20_C0011G0012 [Parcubacteria group bacterium GW2011_GWE2_40_